MASRIIWRLRVGKAMFCPCPGSQDTGPFVQCGSWQAVLRCGSFRWLEQLWPPPCSSVDALHPLVVRVKGRFQVNLGRIGDAHSLQGILPILHKVQRDLGAEGSQGHSVVSGGGLGFPGPNSLISQPLYQAPSLRGGSLEQQIMCPVPMSQTGIAEPIKAQIQ